MKWNCKFYLEGNIDSFYKVLTHEKTHSKDIGGFGVPGFLGDKQNKIVHHLANMKKECQIVNIRLEDRQYFTPDTLEDAKVKSYHLCKFCNP